MMRTLGDVSAATGFAVLEHLEAEAEVPVLDGLQAQGDLFVVPVAARRAGDSTAEVPAAGIPVIEAIGGGHEHRLFAGEPGTAWWTPDGRGGQVIGVVHATAAAYLLHPEHGATGLAPGTYELRRQREQAEEQRLVAD